MSAYILDSDHLSLLQRSHPATLRRVAFTYDAEIAITIVTVEEQLRGWFALIRRHHASNRQVWGYRGLHNAIIMLNEFTIIDFDQSSFDRYEVLRRAYPRISSQDLRIAAITRVYTE